MPDFSSSEYWSNRFATEIHNPFEWLANSELVIPSIIDSIRSVISSRPEARHRSPLSVLHFGCGTSSLGDDVLKALKTCKDIDTHIELVNSDYVAQSLKPPEDVMPRESTPIINLNVLSPLELLLASPQSGWDLLIDKSTADAISCGPDLPPSTIPNNVPGRALIPAIEKLADCLADVTRKGGRWVCISYSSARFPFLDSNLSSRERETLEVGKSVVQVLQKWKLLERKLVATTYIPGGRQVRDRNGVERVVYEPETGVWVYVLERI